MILFINFLFAPLLGFCNNFLTAEGLSEIVNWNEYPWTFDNDLFGVHRQWRMCKSGKLQSPINIDPERIVFDPGLSRFTIGKEIVEADFINAGQFPMVLINSTSIEDGERGAAEKDDVPINIVGGPAYPYQYLLHQVIIHFGDVQTGHRGSEHVVDKVRYPAEIQMLAFNSDLYENFTDAMNQPRGLLAISIIVEIGEGTNAEFRRLTLASKNITFKGLATHLERFRPSGLMPKTEHYVTYEGSLTYPGCFETVTWIIMNSPIYTTLDNLAIWNQMQQSEENNPPNSPPIQMAPNFRPLRALNGRLIRSNINAKLKPTKDSGTCPSNLYLNTGYKLNPKRQSHLQSAHHKHQTETEAKILGDKLKNIDGSFRNASNKSRRHLLNSNSNKDVMPVFHSG